MGAARQTKKCVCGERNRPISFVLGKLVGLVGVVCCVMVICHLSLFFLSLGCSKAILKILTLGDARIWFSW